MRCSTSTNLPTNLNCPFLWTLLHCWWECKLVQPLWKTVWRFLKQLKIELPYYPAIPLLGLCLEKTKMLIQKDTCSPMFMETLFTISKIWKQPKRPLTDEWMKKMRCTYIMEYYSTTQKNEIFPFAATWMELEINTRSEVSQIEKDKYYWHHCCVESKKKN